MPQMSPLNWLTLFFYFTLIFLLLNSNNYYFIKYHYTSKITQMLNLKKNNWKW